MGFILWLIIGGLVGWVASLIMKTDGQQGIILNVVVGIVGAAIAGFLLSPMLGVATINDGSLSIASLVISLVGAMVLIGVVRMIKRA